MSPLQELIAHVPQQGRVRWIGVRPESRGAMVELEAVEARREAGLTGDHARPGPRNARQVTLIQWEHLAVISALLGRAPQQPVQAQDLGATWSSAVSTCSASRAGAFASARRFSRLRAGASPAHAWSNAWAWAPFKQYAAMAESLPG